MLNLFNNNKSKHFRCPVFYLVLPTDQRAVSYSHPWTLDGSVGTAGCQSAARQPRQTDDVSTKKLSFPHRRCVQS